MEENVWDMLQKLQKKYQKQEKIEKNIDEIYNQFKIKELKYKEDESKN